MVHVTSKTGKAPILTKQFGKVRELLESERAGALDGFLFKIYVTILALVLHVIFCHQLAIRVLEWSW